MGVLQFSLIDKMFKFTELKYFSLLYYVVCISDKYWKFYATVVISVPES